MLPFFSLYNLFGKKNTPIKSNTVNPHLILHEELVIFLDRVHIPAQCFFFNKIPMGFLFFYPRPYVKN